MSQYHHFTLFEREKIFFFRRSGLALYALAIAQRQIQIRDIRFL